jgi:hypothetical protein
VRGVAPPTNCNRAMLICTSLHTFMSLMYLVTADGQTISKLPLQPLHLCPAEGVVCVCLGADDRRGACRHVSRTTAAETQTHISRSNTSSRRRDVKVW